MIIITHNKCLPKVEDKLLKSVYNDYITSIEYIDNEFDDILLKITTENLITFFNLKYEIHNPISPARIYFKDGKFFYNAFYIKDQLIRLEHL